MGLEYGNVVVLLRKTRDGENTKISRVNAFVLGSTVHQALRADRTPVLGEDGNPAAPVEHPDLIYCEPTAVSPGQILKTRMLEAFVRHAYDVPPMLDGAWIGWEPLPAAEQAAAEPDPYVEARLAKLALIENDAAKHGVTFTVLDDGTLKVNQRSPATGGPSLVGQSQGVAAPSGDTTSAPSTGAAAGPETEAADAGMGTPASAAPATTEEEPPAEHQDDQIQPEHPPASE